MIVCPVCRKMITEGYICTECGHDESRNVENYLSLVKIPGKVKTLSEEIEDYQNRRTEIRFSALLKERMHSYELQMRKLEDQVSEQKKRLEELEKSKIPADLPQQSETGSSADDTGHAETETPEPEWTKGGIVTFGKYTINGNNREPVEWLVLDIKEGKYLLLSRCGLDIKVYNEKPLNTTWENSIIRIWLNGVFYQSTFNEQEKHKIVTMKAHDNKWFFDPILGYNGNGDYVFLLSTEEARLYFDSDDARKAGPTKYARNSGFKMEYFSKYGKWWLRSQGTRATDAAFVNVNGYVNDAGMDVRTPGVMVRPAIWVSHED